MYCTKCGAVLDENTGLCPVCSVNSAPAPAATVINTEPAKKKYGFGNVTKTAKSYAAIFSALMVFPAMICTVVNLLGNSEKFWAGYVLGALAVAWVFLVLPVMRITPPAVTAVICFVTLSSYLLYIAKEAGFIGWYYSYAMPISLIICAMVCITSILVSKGLAKGIHLPALLSAETALFLICLEIIFDSNMFGFVELRWSLIAMCIFVSFSVICEAIAYVVKLNKK